MRFLVAGVDPGSKGAVAFLAPDDATLAVFDMPTYTITKSRKFTFCDGAALAGLFRQFNPTHTYYERVHSMPSDGAVGAFSFGMSAGVIQGVIAALGLPNTPVDPVTWKKQMQASSVKAESTARAKALFPKCAHLFTRSDKAEAAMLALFGAFSLGVVLKKHVEPLV